MLEQHPCDLGVAMLTGTHERGGAIAVLHVHVRATAEQNAHHRRATVTDRQHQSRLPRLDVRQRRRKEERARVKERERERERDEGIRELEGLL